MSGINVQIVRFTDDSQPGWVECRFRDAWGKEFSIEEKIPIVTTEDLGEDSDYPRPGTIDCVVLKEWEDENRRKLVTVSTYEPWGIETRDWISEFDLLPEQLTTDSTRSIKEPSS